MLWSLKAQKNANHRVKVCALRLIYLTLPTGVVSFLISCASPSREKEIRGFLWEFSTSIASLCPFTLVLKAAVLFASFWNSIAIPSDSHCFNLQVPDAKTWG